MDRREPLRRRTPLGNGSKSEERGSTFASRGEGLRRDTPKTRAATRRAERRPVSPASDAQRAKMFGASSIVSGDGPCDPAHLWPRGMGGCDHPDCVVPLTRAEHRAFDDGLLDLLPFLIAHGCWVELAHMVAVHHVDPVSLLQRLTGDRYVPERAA